MKMTMARLLAALLAGVLAAQEGKPAPANSGTAAQRKVVAAYEAAIKDYQARSKALMASEEWQKAQKADDKDALKAMRAKLQAVDMESFAKQALAEAQQRSGDDAVPLYCQAVIYGGKSDTAKSAFAALREQHVRSAQLTMLLESGGIIARALGPADAASFLEQVIAENQDNAARAWAMYWRSMQLNGRNAPEADLKRAKELAAQAETLAAGTLLAAKIAAPRFEKERLQIGMVAPDIEGVDTDGTAFKLSDYRGKVVVLDYWGFW
jgi:hypothetical protein